MTLTGFILFQHPAHFSFVVTYALIHINDDLALIPGVKKRSYNTGPYCVWGFVSAVKLCWPYCKKICSGVVSVCKCVCERQIGPCVSLHLRKEFWDSDLVGGS